MTTQTQESATDVKRDDGIAASLQADADESQGALMGSEPRALPKLTKTGSEILGRGFRFILQSSETMEQIEAGTIALTVTSPPYWNAIDYDVHAENGNGVWHRERDYSAFGATFDAYLDKIEAVFSEVMRVTAPGGFCAIVVGTILHEGKHYPAPMMITTRMVEAGWEFHQDIIWNKVTGGVKRAGSFIQQPKPGYYYPNIMTEYILVFRKPGAKRRGISESMPIDDVFKRDIANNVWHIAPVPPNAIDHPCPYPEELVRRLVLLYSDVGDTVLDPFLGSGQTAVAALRQGRQCVGYDIEPNYLRLAAQQAANRPSVREFNLLPKFDKVRVK